MGNPASNHSKARARGVDVVAHRCSAEKIAGAKQFKSSLCSQLGVCLCSHHFRAFKAALTRVARLCFQHDVDQLQEGFIFMELVSRKVGEPEPVNDGFYHIALNAGGLKSWQPLVMRMDQLQVSEQHAKLQAPQRSHTLWFNLWEALHQIDKELEWTVTWWKLACDDITILTELSPSVVLVTRCDTPAHVQVADLMFWRGLDEERARARRRRYLRMPNLDGAPPRGQNRASTHTGDGASASQLEHEAACINQPLQPPFRFAFWCLHFACISLAFACKA